MLLRTLPFCVYSVFHSKFFAFNRLRTLLQNTGGGMGFFPFWNRASDKDASPERAQRAEGSLPFFRALRTLFHESQITNNSFRGTFLQSRTVTICQQTTYKSFRSTSLREQSPLSPFLAHPYEK